MTNNVISTEVDADAEWELRELDEALSSGTNWVQLQDLKDLVLQVNRDSSVKESLLVPVMDDLNQAIGENPQIAQTLRNNLFTHVRALKEGVSLARYLSAVKFVSFRLAGEDVNTAWKKTFPKRYAELLANGATNKVIEKAGKNYNSTPLVGKLYEETSIPAWIMNQDLFNKALLTQAELMETAKSEKVRSDAANSVLTHLKRPESVKTSVEVELSDTNVVKDLSRIMQALADQQRMKIIEGSSTTEQLAVSVLDTPSLGVKEVNE